MRYRINEKRINELIQQSGLRLGYIVDRLQTSRATFRRWLKGETPFPLLAAVELANMINAKLEDLYEEVDEDV